MDSYWVVAGEGGAEVNLLRVIVAVPRDPDLSWLLNESSAAAGIRSSFGVLADAATGGWGGGRQDPHEGRTRGYVDKAGHFRQPWLEAVARSRALRTRWDSLAAPEHGVAVQTVLFHAYTEKRCPPETERPLGGLASVAPATSAFRAAYEPADGAPMDWLADVCRRGHHKSLVEEIRKQSLWLIDESLERWRATGPKRGVQGPDMAEGATTRFRRFLEALSAVEGPKAVGPARTWAPMGESSAKGRT